MIRDISGSQRSIDPEIDVVYDYLSDCAINEPPETTIREFNNLFVRGKNEDERVSKIFNKIILSPIEQKYFNLVFSRCFYLIFDRWVARSELLFYIPELFNTIEIINNSSSYDRLRKQLIKLITNYQKSLEYLKLKATIAIIYDRQKLPHKNSKIAEDSKKELKDINSFLARYTFIYEYFIPQDLELKQLDEFVRSLKTNRSRDFEIELSKHIIYRFRLKQVAKMKLLSKGAGKLITKVDSPSLLSEKAFRVALQQYIGKINKKQTLLERSQKFIADNQIRDSYQIFKQDLYLYLTESIKSRNSSYQFERKLKNKLETIFPQSNNKPLNNTQILQTCRQLFSFLITDTNPSENTQEFANLIANLGTAQAVNLLIKITLICPESKSDLEKKIALVIDRYQLDPIQDVPWLIKTLEYLSIAFSIYFGKIDVSIAKSVISNQ